MKTVIETRSGWMIRCRACQWHEFPKVGRPGASWLFNGNMEHPTFSPSMNQITNAQENEHYNPQCKTSRCHFILRDGIINYCNDCSHEFNNQSLPLEPWDDATVKYYETLKETGEW